MRDQKSEELLRRDWILFSWLTFFFSFGFAVYSGPFQNFLRDVMGAHEIDLGLLESLREIPGLLTALMAGTLVAFAETRIASVGLFIGAIGIGLTGVFNHLPPVMAITVFWSVGFHLWATMQTAITLALAKGKDGGRHLGRMSGVAAVATIGGLGVVYLLTRFLPGQYGLYFGVAGAAIFVASLLGNRLSTHAAGGKRERLVFRKEYGLFYLLTFLEGCRRQIFSIFAQFTLILVYKIPVQEIVLIQLVNSVMIFATAPAIGKMVDKVGERAPLTYYAIGLIVVFLGYASFKNASTLIALYLIDNVLFSFGVGFNTYLHRIVRKGELTPCLAMGTTMNHIAAVTVPYFGALLWMRTANYQAPFWVGVAIACVSLVATRWLPTGAAPVADSDEHGIREPDASDGIANVLEHPHSVGEIV